MSAEDGQAVKQVKGYTRKAKSKPAAGLRMHKFDLSILKRQCRTVLGRELRCLMKASHKRKLDAKDADSLIKYTRLIRELETEETREVEQEVARKLAEEASKPNE